MRASSIFVAAATKRAALLSTWSQLAILVVGAAGIAAGCFNPSLTASECADNNQCPNGLECSLKGFCCESGVECAPDVDIDAATPDAAVTSFSDFGPYICDSDTMALLHFNESNSFSNDLSCPGMLAVNAQASAFSVASPMEDDQFLMAANLHSSNSDGTRYVSIRKDELANAVPAYTVELFAKVEHPNPGTDMVLASALQVTNDVEITAAVFELTVDENYYLTVRLFPSVCKVATAGESLSPTLSFKSTSAIAPNSMSHLRLVVTTTDAYLFINGELDVTQELAGAVCMSPNAAELRIGGVDRVMAFEFGDRRGLRGQVDEFRYSKTARLPPGLQ